MSKCKSDEQVSPKDNSVEVFGKKYSSVAELARVVGINENTIRSRVRKGCTLEEAVSMGKYKHTVLVAGKEFRNLKEASKYYGVTYSTVTTRIKQGWSLEEALKSEKISPCKEVVVDGMIFSSLKEVCKYYDVMYSNVKGRLNRGWSLEEALGVAKRGKYGTNKKILVDGKEFSSVVEACGYYEIPIARVRSRLQLGWSNEEVFGLLPREFENVLDRVVWNKNIYCIKILEYLGNGYYKCFEDGNVRYYSKKELVEKWKEFNSHG